ncbi:MAG: integrase core domain-containing protein [Oscillospiraceae bacterium]|nr:integrase core domain-containing protein [Oscillospiraceae bacterium]
MREIVALLEYDGPTEGPTYLHTDQGTVYASMAYADLIKDKNNIRSMSRPGKPTDNPVNESLNGWIKEELFLDFHINDYNDPSWVSWIIEEYVDYYNSERPSYALKYETPDNYYKLFKENMLTKKNTFYVCSEK